MSLTFDYKGSEEADISETVSGKSDVSSIANKSIASKAASSDKRSSSVQDADISEDHEETIGIQEDEADESDECGVKVLLVKNTASFRCFIQVAVSNSSIMREKLYHFPPLNDPGIDEAYFYQGEIFYNSKNVE